MNPSLLGDVIAINLLSLSIKSTSPRLRLIDRLPANIERQQFIHLQVEQEIYLRQYR
jgi:hypothetical protein